MELCMMKKLLIAYLFTLTNVFAGLPPTTLKGQSDTLKSTTFNFEVPNFQATSLNGTTKLFETGNSNELVNADFEHSTVDYGWSFANGTRSSSSSALSGKKALSVALTGAVEIYQESTVNAARKDGVQMVASVFVNSSDVSDLQLCSLKNGAEDKCTVTGGYVQGSGWRQLTVSFLGDSTSNGLKLKSTDTTGTVLVDQAFVGVGSPIVDFTPDMEYSAKISATGGIISQNTEFITSCTNANPIVCSLKSGVFTVAPACSAVIDYGGSGAVTVRVSAISTTSMSFERFDLNAGINNGGVMVVCQKQGADYKTSKAYVASGSANGLSAGSIVAVATASCPIGTISADGSAVSRSTYAELFSAIGTTHGQGDGSTTFNVPDYRGRFLRGVDGSAGLDPDKASRTAMNTGGNTGNNVGSVQADAFQGHEHTTETTFYGGSQQGGGSGNGNPIKTNGIINKAGYGTARYAAETRPKNAYVNYCIRTTAQNVIVGSFQGYNETPGTSRVETFSFSYGKTATTVCDSTGLVNTNQCAYLDQIGNNVTSVTRTGTGNYVLNFTKTFSKLKCSLHTLRNPTGLTFNALEGGGSCSSCSTRTLKTYDTAANPEDIFGTINCQGIPQ